MSTFSENLKGEKFNFQIPIFETKESNSSLKTSDSITTNSNIKQIKNVSFKKDFVNVIIVENWKKYNYDISQFRCYWKDEEKNLKKEEININHINYINPNSNLRKGNKNEKISCQCNIY